MGSKLYLGSTVDASLAYIPQDIITDILVLLPVESLCRFKCVSKIWSSLITSPCFINYHLQVSSEKLKKESNHKIMMMFTKANNQQLQTIPSYSCSVKLLVLDKCRKDVKTTNNKLEVDMSKSFPFYSTIVGSSNGLYCINTFSDIIFWNPSIRKLKHVPKFPHRFSSHFGNFGFAYDESADDYRVVDLNGSRFDLGITDYSLRRNDWKKSHECDIDGQIVSSSCPFLGGNLHWLLEKCDKSLIALSYNLKTETLGKIMLPHSNEGVGNGFEPVTLGVLRGCLCMIFWFDYSIVIWTMNDYGIHESWSKAISYSGEQRLSWNHLMWSSAGHEDDILLSSSQGLGLFRAKDGIMKECHCWKDCSCFDEVENFRFIHYVESLVSPILNNK